jgi:hypothetical protein
MPFRDASEPEFLRQRVRNYEMLAGGVCNEFEAVSLAAGRSTGVELMGEPGPTWQRFRGLDGNVYELMVVSAGNDRQQQRDRTLAPKRWGFHQLGMRRPRHRPDRRCLMRSPGGGPRCGGRCMIPGTHASLRLLPWRCGRSRRLTRRQAGLSQCSLWSQAISAHEYLCHRSACLVTLDSLRVQGAVGIYGMIRNG